MKQLRLSLLPLLVLALLASSCKTRPSGGSLGGSLTAETKAVCLLWKNDAFGCKKDRTAPRGEAIVAAFFSLKPTRAAIEEVLGKAENTSNFKGITKLEYYFDTQCSNGKMVPNSVYCVLELNISDSSGKMETGGVVCG